MEIGGPSFPLSPYSGIDPTGRYPQQAPQHQPPPKPAPPLKQVVKPEAYGQENRQRRFYSIDQDLSHSSRQALNSYRDLDDIAGGELMNRVDVYA